MVSVAAALAAAAGRRHREVSTLTPPLRYIEGYYARRQARVLLYSPASLLRPRAQASDTAKSRMP